MDKGQNRVQIILLAVTALVLAGAVLSYFFFKGSAISFAIQKGYEVPKEFEQGQTDVKRNYNPKNKFSSTIHTTNEPFDELIVYYRSLLQTDGWTIEKDDASTDISHRFYANKDSNSISIYIEEEYVVEDIDNPGILVEKESTVSID